MPTTWRMKQSNAGKLVSRSERLFHIQQQHQRSKSREALKKASSRTNPLLEAVFRGCLECIRVLVETPPFFKVDTPCGPNELRPIHIASREGHLHILRYLSSAGASVEKCDLHGFTGLHHAAVTGQVRAVRWLLRHGAQITLDERGRTPSQIAADHGYDEIVTLLSNHSCGTINFNNTIRNNSPTTNEIINSITLSDTTTVLVHTTDDEQHRHRWEAERSGHELCLGGTESETGRHHQDSSSSGNSSLVNSSSGTSPSSFSPSTVCSCSVSERSSLTSDENNEEIDSSTHSSDTVITIGTTASKFCEKALIDGSRSNSQSPNSSFFLHPPKSSLVTLASDTVEPFYLHPPSEVNSSSANPTSVHFLEPEFEAKMAPVTPVNSDYIPSSSGKDEKSELDSQLPAATSPPAKNTGKVMNAVSPSPPPPPPPMPSHLQHTSGISKKVGPSPLQRARELYTEAEVKPENEYEVISEIQNQPSYEELNPTRKLNRSVSAPPPPPIGPAFTEPIQEPTCASQIQPKGVPPGMLRPFIPPNFPDPPKDALIKPSEYLKKIQQNKKGNTATASSSVGNGLSAVRPSGSRVEEVIKMLNGTEMPSVPEEATEVEEAETENAAPGGIRPEELMKVNLRKTQMSRTLSAPPLDRTLPSISPPQTSPHAEAKRPNNIPLLNKVNASPQPSPTAAIIAELAESSQAGGVREWKEELRRRRKEEDTQAAKEIASIYSPLKFVAEVPETDGSGAPIPEWKRQMLAKKAAEKAKKEAEEQRKLEAEAKRASVIPLWKRQLMQRRDNDGKTAQ